MKNLHLLPTDKPKAIIYYCKQNDPYCISPNCRCNTVKIEDHKPVQVMKRQGTTFVSKLEEPKFHVGQRVIVCNTLKTIITKIEDEKYYFLDEIGNVMWDEESLLEPIIEPKQETLEERNPYWDLVDKKAEQNNTINLDAYANGVIDGAAFRDDQLLEFLHSEITERRDYSASKMCEKVIEFINNTK